MALGLAVSTSVSAGAPWDFRAGVPGGVFGVDVEVEVEIEIEIEIEDEVGLAVRALGLAASVRLLWWSQARR